MNKLFVRTLLLVLLAAVLLTPSCKAFVWDPSGVWQFQINYLAVTTIQHDTLAFTGTDSSGVVTGYTDGSVFPPQSGTYTKSGDFSVVIIIDFVFSNISYMLELTCTSSEGSPNYMTGIGTFMINGIFASNLAVTATKTTNLQD